MFAIQRRESILEILNDKGTVQVTELVQLLGVSDVTVRKDLSKLQDEGLITKTHGGAVLNKEIANQSMVQSTQSDRSPASDLRQALAQHAAATIEDGETLFLGSGRTCTAFAKSLNNFNDLSIITNNVEAVQYLRGKCKTVILIGGEVIFHQNHSFTSSTQIDSYLSEYNINTAITSCTGIDRTFGISVSTEVSRNIINAVVNAAKSWIVVADSDKFDAVSPYKIADLEVPEMIVTDIDSPAYREFSNIKCVL